MCVLVGGIERVSNTKIFAAPGKGGRQRLVYSMDLETRNPVAMILPLPVDRHAGKDALRFVDLSGYAELFDDLAGLFTPMTLGSDDGTMLFESAEAPLPVHAVGDFEASYVPSHDDWERLDPRFRLGPAIWEQLPRYHDFAFAVFRLAPRANAHVQRIHPMAFEFATRTPGELFFPTVHIHDGRVHPSAEFDHDLYCQLPAEHPQLVPYEAGGWMLSSDREDWQISMALLRSAVDAGRAKGLVDPDAPVLLRQIHGEHPNRDVVVAG